jgi:hypothetical protein
MRLHTPSVRQLTGIATIACSAALIPAAALAATSSPAAPGTVGPPVCSALPRLIVVVTHKVPEVEHL